MYPDAVFDLKLARASRRFKSSPPARQNGVEQFEPVLAPEKLTGDDIGWGSKDVQSDGVLKVPLVGFGDVTAL